MTKTWVVRTIEIGVILAIVIAGFGRAVLELWNLLMPDIFGLPRIGFWQAVGLLGLSWILFGGLPGFFGPMRGMGRHNGMTPEERELFRRGMQGGRRACGETAAESQI
jgi:hypothetical protein